MIKRLAAAGIATILALVTVHVAMAQDSGDHVSVHDRYVLHTGEALNGNTTIIAREAEFEPGSKVAGNLSIISATTVIMDGEIEGNVSILAKSTRLNKDFHLVGDLTVCSQEYAVDPGASITGNQNTGCNQLSSVVSEAGRNAAGSLDISLPFVGNSNDSLITRFFRVVATSFAVAALAALAAAVFPRQINRLTGTAMTTMATTVIVGFLSLCVAIAITVLYLLLVVLTVGIACLASPLVALAWLVIGIALLIGWIALSIPIGRMILHRRHIYPTPMVAAATGALVLTFAQGLLSLIPCVNVFSTLLTVILGSAGFGAVLLTRFGTRPYPEIVTARACPDIV